MNRNRLAGAVSLALAMIASPLMAQTDTGTATVRQSVSSTSNSTLANDTKRAAAKLAEVQVQANSLSIGAGQMEVQTAPKAVSTISREAIQQAAPGATFVQMIASIPGVNASTDDVTGLSNGNVTIRGYTLDEVGVTVNGAPINDSGNYKIYSTEYGDAENMGDITVQQGYPDVDTPMPGAAGGSIAWTTIDPSHKGSVDISQSIGSYGYKRTFVRLNTGDTGPFRSWVSYSFNEDNMWRGPGQNKVNKIDAKTVWTINDKNSISASLQYNRMENNYYLALTKAAAQQDYKQSYSPVFVPNDLSNKDNANYYGLHINPFRSLLVSLDGEFTLSDNLHLSVVPYFQYGVGGGSGTALFTESTNGQHWYGYSNQDLNGNGVVGGKNASALVYDFNYSNTYRPGVIAKLMQDFGDNDSLTYGVWTEAPRQQQGENFSTINPQTGQPSNVWGNDANVIKYSNGQVMNLFDQYTATTTRKAFATNTWTPNDKWTFNLGLSYLWVEREGYSNEYPTSTGPGTYPGGYVGYGSTAQQSWHKVTPTSGVKFQLDDRNQFYLGVGKTFRAPINGSAYNSIYGGGLAAGALNPAPESAWTYDLGWRFYGQRVSANVDAYASDFTNKQVSGFDGNTFQTVYLSLGAVHMRGLNGELNVKLDDHFSVYSSYSFTQAIMQSNLNTGSDGIYYTAGKTLTNTPRNILNVGVNYKQGPFWAGLYSHTTSAIWGDWSNTQSAGGYTTLNLNAGVTLPDWGWMHKPYIKLNAMNLLNRQALTFSSSATAFLASNPTGLRGSNGIKLYASEPTYSLLEGRSAMITVGANFF